jgi:hypothetical protein
MRFHDSEAVKYLFDHLKSVWTLSAGGLAASIAVFGYVVKESHLPGPLNIPFGIGCVTSLSFFVYSIHKGISAQRDLINEVSRSETDEASIERSGEDAFKKMVASYASAKSRFFRGCMVLVATAFLFLTLNSLIGKTGGGGLSISVKNATLTTPDSKTVEVRDLVLRLPDSVSPVSKTIEIKDLTFTVKAIEGQP